MNIAFQNGDGKMTGRIPTAVTVPYAQEYSATTANGALLHELASSTGGRVLALADLESIDLFDDTDVVFPESPQSIWDLLAILAASILIIDVAIRRLWMDKKSMKSMLAPVGSVTTGSVDALRKVHRQVEKNNEEPHIQSSLPTPKKQDLSAPKDSIEAQDDNLSQLLKNKRKRSGGDKE